MPDRQVLIQQDKTFAVSFNLRSADSAINRPEAPKRRFVGIESARRLHERGETRAFRIQNARRRSAVFLFRDEQNAYHTNYTFRNYRFPRPDSLRVNKVPPPPSPLPPPTGRARVPFSRTGQRSDSRLSELRSITPFRRTQRKLVRTLQRPHRRACG